MSEAIAALIAGERLPADYAAVVEKFWQPVAAEIARRAETRRPLLVGINGAQGSGKTTVCRFLEPLLAERGLIAATLALDDLYLTHTARLGLAANIHPLFATRGVPGTHDVALGKAILDRLLKGRPAEVPVFDKALDDRAADTRHVAGSVDIVLFEGWCVGARPQPTAALTEPVNALERDEDPTGTWRRAVNRRLTTDYAELFARLDMLIMLKVPDFEAVRAHRRVQESKLGTGPAVMDDAALDRFLAHYQRLTEAMLEEMPGRADVLVEIGRDQRPVWLSTRPRSV
jgi:D-glycerate 3-kinase